MASNFSTTNYYSRLLTPQENMQLSALLIPGCQSLFTTVAQVLVTDPPRHSEWRTLGCYIVCFVKNKNCHSFFISAYDLHEGMLKWEQELYLEMIYHKSLPFFHAFEAESSMAGLNFADPVEAEQFYAVVQNKLMALKKHENRQDDQLQRNATAIKRPPIQSQGTGSAFGVLAPMKLHAPDSSAKIRPEKSQVKKGKPQLTKDSISSPVIGSFQHITHLGFDKEKGWDYDEKDPFVQELCNRAGINMANRTEQEKEFIYGYIENELGGIKSLQAAVHAHKAKNQWLGVVQSRSASVSVQQPHYPSVPPTAPTIPLVKVPVKHDYLSPPVPPRRVGSLGDLSQVPIPPPPPPNPIARAVGVPVPPPAPPISVPVDSNPQNALLGEILKGATLKPVVRAESGRSLNIMGRDQLMEDIKSGHINLRKVASSENIKEAVTAPLDGMALALARALQARRGAIEQPGSDEDQSDHEWDD